MQLHEMTDDQVLAAAGDCGPAIIGQALFDRAQAIRVQNPTGALGPAIIGTSRPNDLEAAREAEALDDDTADAEDSQEEEGEGESGDPTPPVAKQKASKGAGKKSAKGKR